MRCARVACAALFVLLTALAAEGLYIKLPPRTQECIHRIATQGQPLVGSFEVSRGGDLDIDAKLVAPSGKVLFVEARQRAGRFDVPAPASGKYSLCLSNTMSTVSDKVVSFAFHAGDEKRVDVATVAQVSPLQESLSELAEAVMSIAEEQRYMRTRARVHHETSESTLFRLSVFSLLETAALVGMCAWQLYYMSRFFEVKARV